MKNNILFLVAHPNIENSILNKKIIQNIHHNKYKKNIIIRKLYNIYPDFKIKVEEEIRIILNTKFIVFQFPFYWYSYPSLLKEWKDKVFTKLYKKKSLSGKHLLVSITTGSEKKTFHAGEKNNFTIDEFLRPIQQTAHICNMIYHGYVQISIHMVKMYGKSCYLENYTDKIIFRINEWIQ
ncbi:NAD(P)H-dependent oxidoreductase [Blattabacterium clevelandi]|uniref:NAD(P)H-dependent oxidoreductase n=1 Tax=Blattabacterium clevelandi TaxID=164516 RepID=UPI000DE5B707|nr:NAD(P)H-dependent oxidoreductase [Blattabacterium clevelandi]